MKMLAKLIVTALILGFAYPAQAKILESLITLEKIDHGKVQLTYTGKTAEKLHVVIYDQKDRTVFKEVVKTKSGFRKPYNISSLPYGEYRFEIRVEDEIVSQKVDHQAPPYPGNVKLLSNAYHGGKFRMMIVGPGYKDFKLRVYSQNNILLYQERIQQSENYGKIVNLNGANPGSVTLVLSNKDGVLQRRTINL